MFKPAIMLVDEIEPPRLTPIRLRMVLLIALGVCLIPLAVEAAAICYSQWCEVMGRANDVRTPYIDAIRQGFADARESLAEHVGPPWNAGIQNPSIALPVSSVLIIVAMAMLRR